jgi:hypothetical protein
MRPNAVGRVAGVLLALQPIAIEHVDRLLHHARRTCGTTTQHRRPQNRCEQCSRCSQTTRKRLNS